MCNTPDQLGAVLYLTQSKVIGMTAGKDGQRRTPGVYVTEQNAFPPSIVGVATAVPVFIGYSARADINGRSVTLKPVRIESLADFESVFGRGYTPPYQITATDGPVFDVEVAIDGTPTQFVVSPADQSRFHLYNSLRLFFDNGGGTCFVVSVGTYLDAGAEPVRVELKKLQEGLQASAEQVGPTMVVIPDAVLLPSDGHLADSSVIPFSNDFQTLVQGMLRQCSELRDRVAILDVYGTGSLDQANPQFASELSSLVERFHSDVGDTGLNYGMSYFPFLRTTVVSPDEVDFLCISDPAELESVLRAQASDLYSGNEQKLTIVEGLIDQMVGVDRSDSHAVTSLNAGLANALPAWKQITQSIAADMGVLPPSGALAGLYALNDQSRGVWNAPANYRLVSVIDPTVAINDSEQGDLNAPPNGKAIDVIRAFPGRGTVVWGARTLDSLSNDWRYIQIRRTVIYIEQSIRNALDPFVFEPNDGNTWARVVSLVSNFLQGLWTQGGLMGATASEAFRVECGLGSTMTPQDIQEGYMTVRVTLRVVHPAEFIVLMFQQQMEG